MHCVTAQRRARAVKRNNHSCFFKLKCGPFSDLSAPDAVLSNISKSAGFYQQRWGRSDEEKCFFEFQICFVDH